MLSGEGASASAIGCGCGFAVCYGRAVCASVSCY